MGKNKIIGKKVKAIREEKNISYEELCEKCKLTEQQIKQIEENTEIPSLAPLIKIARALGVRVGTFLDESEQNGPVVCRKGDCDNDGVIRYNPESCKHMTYRSLSNNKSGRHMEPFLISLEPMQDADIVLSSHEGEEFILVLEGCVRITYGDETYSLNQGDSIYYDAVVPHIMNACNEHGAKLLAVLYTPV